MARALPRDKDGQLGLGDRPGRPQGDPHERLRGGRLEPQLGDRPEQQQDDPHERQTEPGTIIIRLAIKCEEM